MYGYLTFDVLVIRNCFDWERSLTNSYKLIEPGFVKLLRDIGGDAAVESSFNVLSEKLYGRGEIGTKVREALNPSYFGDTAKLSKSLTELGALPDHWEVRYTSRGQRYFVNHSTRTTQFTGELTVHY